jgi:hypothetical protein
MESVTGERESNGVLATLEPQGQDSPFLCLDIFIMRREANINILPGIYPRPPEWSTSISDHDSSRGALSEMVSPLAKHKTPDILVVSFRSFERLKITLLPPLQATVDCKAGR